MEVGYVNGKFINIDERVIPIQERGHQFGDGIYEVVRVYNFIPFLLDEHLERLIRSAKAIKLKLPYTLIEMKDIINEGIRKSELGDAEVYFQVTRGIADRNHSFPNVNPSFTMTVRPVREISNVHYKNGVKVATTEDIRWAHCYIKSLNLLPNILAKQEAVDNGCYEAVFVKQGNVIEGSSTNVFAVKNGVLYTTPITKGILPGITRQMIINLAKGNNIPVKEEFYTLEFLKNADEAFITSTIAEVLPVQQVDKSVIGTPGSSTLKLQKLYKTEIEHVIHGKKSY